LGGGTEDLRKERIEKKEDPMRVVCSTAPFRGSSNPFRNRRERWGGSQLTENRGSFSYGAKRSRAVGVGLKDGNFCSGRGGGEARGGINVEKGKRSLAKNNSSGSGGLNAHYEEKQRWNQGKSQNAVVSGGKGVRSGEKRSNSMPLEEAVAKGSLRLWREGKLDSCRGEERRVGIGMGTQKGGKTQKKEKRTLLKVCLTTFIP